MKHLSSAWLLLFAIAILSSVARAEPRLFVAPSGSDSSNNCTDMGSPCATIQHAIDVTVSAGTSICVATGQYPESLNITVDGSPSFPNRIIDCQGGRANVVAIDMVAKNWIIDPSIVAGRITVGGGGGGGPATVATDNITVQGDGSVGNRITLKAVQVDGSSITGKGTVADPLVATATLPATDNVTLQGTGAVGNKLAIKAVQVDGSTITGSGAVGDPLVGLPVPILTDNVTTQGNGTAGSKVAIKAVQVDGATITGTGAVGNPLVGGRTAAGIGGNVPNTCGLDGWCNVVNFGADITGVADSEPAFSATLAAAIANKKFSVYIPPGDFNLAFPWWVHSDVNLNDITVMGAGGISRATRLKNNYVFVSPVTGLTGIDTGCGNGNEWVAPLIGATGQSMCNSTPFGWFFDLKQLLLAGTTKADPLTGLAALSAEYWFQGTNNTNGYILGASGNDGTETTSTGQIGPMRINYTCTGASGNMTASVHTTGGILNAINSGSVSDLCSAVHFYQAVYDGSTLSWYVDGSASGTPQALTGTIVDKPYYSLTVGSGAAWPPQYSGLAYHGKLFGFRLSKVARSPTNPGAALSCDANTIVLLNGTNVKSDESTSSTSGPFVKPECMNGTAAGFNGWLLMHKGGTSTGLSPVLKGFQVFNDATGGYGIAMNEVRNAQFEDLYMNLIPEAGIFLENNSWSNTFINLQTLSLSPATAGIIFTWPGAVVVGSAFNDARYNVVDMGGNIFSDALLTPASTSLGCLITLGGGNPNVQEDLTTFGCDEENGATAPIISGDTEVINIRSSNLISGGPSILRLGNNVDLHLDGDQNFLFGGSSLVSMGFVNTSTPLTTISINGGQLQVAKPFFNTVPITDGNGQHYEVTDMGSKTLAGSTAGTASLSCSNFTDNYKRCIVTLTAWDSTAKFIMIPRGATSFGSVTAITGSCSAPGSVTVGTGSNAGCIAAGNPWPCCTGSTTGTCNLHQFVTLPTAGAQTGQCVFEGL